MVVLVAMIPSAPHVWATSTIASMASKERSGDIFRKAVFLLVTRTLWRSKQREELLVLAAFEVPVCWGLKHSPPRSRPGDPSVGLPGGNLLRPSPEECLGSFPNSRPEERVGMGALVGELPSPPFLGC